MDTTPFRSVHLVLYAVLFYLNLYMTHVIALIGTGSPENRSFGDSTGMAYDHASAYGRLDSCTLVACADLVREHAKAFAAEFNVPAGNVYEDYEKMLYSVEPDIVSVVTPVPTHDDIVIGIAETGIVDAIHCEKPMSNTYGRCEEMYRVCEEWDVQLTFNHQRRFDRRWTRGRRLLEDGEIGELERIEMSAKNIFDWGTHLVDLANSYNSEVDPAWVLAGLDYQEENVRYGTHNENQALVLWRWENGVHGLASTGQSVGTELVGCKHRLIGTDGVIEIGGDVDVRIQRDGEVDWTEMDLGIEVLARMGDHKAFDRAIEHIVDCLNSGSEPQLSAEKTLRTMEMIFGAYESVRSRRRVEFPLDVSDNPLEAMVEGGELRPEPAGPTEQ